MCVHVCVCVYVCVYTCVYGCDVTINTGMGTGLTTYHMSREVEYSVDPMRTSGGRYHKVTTSFE